jgi:hypothetical protein
MDEGVCSSVSRKKLAERVREVAHGNGGHVRSSQLCVLPTYKCMLRRTFRFYRPKLIPACSAGFCLRLTPRTRITLDALGILAKYAKNREVLSKHFLKILVGLSDSSDKRIAAAAERVLDRLCSFVNVTEGQRRTETKVLTGQPARYELAVTMQGGASKRHRQLVLHQGRCQPVVRCRWR